MRFSLAITLLLAICANTLATNSSAPSIYPDINNRIDNPGYMVIVYPAECSGFFVAPDRVLTAKHCTYATSISYGGNGPNLPKRIAVTTNEVDRSQDVAVLYLAQSAYGIALLPISLNPQCPTDETLTVYGFGYSSEAETGAGILRRLVVSVDGCESGSIDVQGKGGSGGCEGDSGGPFVNGNGQAIALTEGPQISATCHFQFHGPMLSSVSNLLREHCAHCAGIA